MQAPPGAVYRAAAEVERWPDLLPHYRRVHVREARGDSVIVEMAAWRPFGPLRYPTWWVSEMWRDPAACRIRYRHIEGITRGMDVLWEIRPDGAGSDVTIVHEWEGPDWPAIGPLAASWVIGPVFIHGIASRTLAGLGRYLEEREAGSGKREAGSGKRETGNGKRETGNGKREVRSEK